jgi:heptosyltransferase-1
MRDILFIKTSSLGDVIHHMPAVTDARKHLPDARFSWAVEEAFAPIAALHPAIDEIIPVPIRRLRRNIMSWSAWRDVRKFIGTVRSRPYDAIVDTQGLFRTGIISKFAQGKRHGYERGSVRERGAAMFYDIHHTVPRGLHAIARNRALSGLALGYTPEGPPDFGLDRDSLAGAVRAPYAILLHATAQRSKEWPEERWQTLARTLERDINLLVPYGSDTERVRAERIADKLEQTRVPIHRSLDNMARMIAGASFVVGVDTGILHLAAALGVPLAAIFCGSKPQLTGPLGSGPMEVLGSDGSVPTVDEVLAAVRKIAPR